MARNPYDVLGVAQGASKEEIKAAYRKLAKEHHPDMNGGDDAKFKEVNSAYESLNNPSNDSGMYGMGADFFSEFSRNFGFNFGASPFAGFSTNRPRRGPNLRHKVDVTLYEFIVGAEKELTLDYESTCQSCNGAGATEFTSCAVCNGSGFLRQSQQGQMFAATCPSCRGRGKQPKNRCQMCSGTGKVRVNKKVKVNIPAGIDPASLLTLPGHGGEGLMGGPPGDLELLLKLIVPPKSSLSPTDLDALQRILHV